MNIEKAIAVVGMLMFLVGLIMYYSIDTNHIEDSMLRFIKNIGTFIGLSGIGVVIAGMLLILIRRSTPSLYKGDGM